MRAKTNTFYGHYADIIRPYKINTSNSAAATAPADVSHQIYAAVQEGVLTTFLWWNGIVCRGGAHILMLYLVLSYFPWMVMLPSTRYNLSFASKGKVMCGIIMCANWLIESLHQIRTAVSMVCDVGTCTAVLI